MWKKLLKKSGLSTDIQKNNFLHIYIPSHINFTHKCSTVWTKEDCMKSLSHHLPTFIPKSKEMALMDGLRKQILRGLFVFMVISNVFFFLRIFLRLFGADPANPFAAFIFAISSLFMFPFFGIFPQYHDQIIAGEMTVDISAFVAGFCYNILSIAAMVITQIVVSILRTRKQVEQKIETPWNKPTHKSSTMI